MLARLACVSLLLCACQQGVAMSPAQMDAFHRNCQARIKSGFAVTERPNAVGRTTPKKPAGTPVIVYGASWCEACTIAKDYMVRLKIPYVDYDVEDDEAAYSAMLSTLAAAELPYSHTLPIIDVRGTVTEGFNPCVLEAAWYES